MRKECIEELELLSEVVYHDMGKSTPQKILDITQDDLIDLIHDVDDENFKERLGAFSYELENLIDVWNPELYGMRELKKLNSIINKWYEYEPSKN